MSIDVMKDVNSIIDKLEKTFVGVVKDSNGKIKTDKNEGANNGDDITDSK